MSNSFRRIAVVLSAGLLWACTTGDSDDPSGAPDDQVDPAAAASDLRVDVALRQATYAAADAVFADVTITNTSAQDIELLSWMLPAEDLEEPVFTVTQGGRAAAYVGAHYKRPAAGPADFVRLAAGATLTRQVELSKFYDLSRTGDYEVRLAIDEHDLRPGRAAAAPLTSNAARAFIEGRAVRPVDPVGPVTTLAGTLSFSRCDATQQSTATSAAGVANTMSDGALAYLSGSPTASQRYTTWFGTFSSSGWNTAKTHFTAIADAFDTKAVTIDCGCKKTYYAYVYPTQPYKIYVCKAFWAAPLSGTDSKGGTLIHEMSHFNVVAATDDWAYGQSAAKSLAISNPTNALDNADSHEYFAENTPALP